ncbi:hypothetical protein V1389_17890, partial [Flavobacterium rakeshii]|nr:hypothetical protein [Flavobacterium rakeshii]
TEITGGNVDYAVSYYMTYADADSATNVIANPATYQNTTPFTEAIYVRLENTVTGCYSVYDFDLIINPLPMISNPAPEFHACEEVPGQGDFVLHDHDTAVTGGQGGMAVRYFATQGAAEIGDPADELPQVYIAPDSTIYARVTVTATGCWRVVAVPLVVEPAPISPALDALEECDFNLDDVAVFNVQAVLDDITNQLGGPGVVTVTAHETQDDADFGSNAITTAPAYSNVEAFTTNGVQTLYIRVSSALTVCYDVEELQLIV